MGDISSNNTYDALNELPDRSWCELKLEIHESSLEICDDCPGKEPFCRKDCEIFIESAYD